MSHDGEILRSYVRDRSEDAFAELVGRYVDLVYSAALRQLAGDAALAEDVVQQVFSGLSQKADTLTARESIAGWLFTHTRFLCLNTIRCEQRRRAREQKAHTMNSEPNAANRDHWNEIEPVLDDALAELPDSDREALLMRFFRKKHHSEIGEEMGASSEAARKRISRALEKLRAVLRNRGVVVPATALTLTLTQKAVVAAPATLVAGAIATASIPAASTTLLGTLQIMTTKVKLITAVAVAAGVATPIVLQQRSIQDLQQQNIALSHRYGQLAEMDSLRAEVERLAKFENDQSELDQLRKGRLELLDLRSEVGRLRDKNAQLGTSLAKIEARNRELAKQSQQADPSQATNEKEQWISAAARLRNMKFSGKPLSEDEIKWLEDAKPIIEQMERDPKQFSEFQTELIQETVQSLDADRIAQIEKIIANTYEQAVAQGLDIPSKPVENYEDWVQRRHKLDRAGTEAVQNLLTAEERRTFDQKFLGVMGVDLGTGVDHSDYPPGFLATPIDGQTIAGEAIVRPDGTIEIIQR